jgi:uncharacterized protein YndB with AHSA1/START domain
VTNPRRLRITTPSDREIAMSRAFDAPRELVFEALTRPELVKRWLGMQNGWFLAVCEIDPRVGGSFRYVWRRADGKEMGMQGVYREFIPPERIVHTEVFDDPWYPGDAVITSELVEKAGETTLTTTVRYDSREIRDSVLASPMERGVAASYDELDRVLASRAGSR